MALTPYWNWFNQVLEQYRPALQPIAGPNVVIGYAKNYRLADLDALLTSHGRHLTAPLILMGTLPDAERMAAEGKGCQIVSPRVGSGWRPLPAFERIVESLCVLRALPDSVERVVWCDTRDLVFQRDPFRSPFEADIVLHSESASPQLGNTAAGRWLARALGEDALRPIAGALMANCGVVLARRPALERFLRIVGILGGVTRHRLSRIPSLALDQALFNYAAHHQLAGPTLVAPNLGRVANLYGVEAATLQIRDGLLCAPDTGVPFEIVHMFDRHPRTIAWAHEQYGWRQQERRPRPRVLGLMRRLKASVVKRLPEIRF